MAEDGDPSKINDPFLETSTAGAALRSQLDPGTIFTAGLAADSEESEIQ